MGRTESIIKKFPSFFQSEERENVFYRFIDVFGRTLDEVESDLLKVMRAHWVDTAGNEGSKGFNTTQKGDLDKIFSLYLENLGGTSQLKQVERRQGPDGRIDDDIYRERIKGLINVLKSGASTKEGITAIVAANLGIVGDNPEAVEARQKIRIIEYLPQPVRTDDYHLAFFEEFVVNNPNVIPVTPDIRIRVRSEFPVPLVNPRIVNISTGKFAQYDGTVKGNDLFSLFSDGTVLLNGIQIPVTGSTPVLYPGESLWRFEASVGLSSGKYDNSFYDFSLFDESHTQNVGRFDAEGSNFDEVLFTSQDPVVDLHMTILKLAPASFMVLIPWDIPGFTEKFDDLAENPRNQIQYIVNKVKAAGVFAVIAYEKRFVEEQGMEALLTIRIPLKEEHIPLEADFNIGSVQSPYTGGIEHELSDTFRASGVFDVTAFDTLNSFA